MERTFFSYLVNATDASRMGTTLDLSSSKCVIHLSLDSVDQTEESRSWTAKPLDWKVSRSKDKLLRCLWPHAVLRSMSSLEAYSKASIDIFFNIGEARYISHDTIFDRRRMSNRCFSCGHLQKVDFILHLKLIAHQN